MRDPSGLVAGVISSPGYVFDDVERTWQTTQRLQRKLGSHKLSLGADLIHSDFALLGGGNPDGNFTVDLTATQLATLAASGKGLALSAQDVLALNPAVSSYSIELHARRVSARARRNWPSMSNQWQIDPRLTATMGLRWDYDNLTALGGRTATEQFCAAFCADYHPDARSTLRFGAGLFYGKSWPIR